MQGRACVSILVGVAIAASGAAAQDFRPMPSGTGSLTGRIIDDDSRRPIEGAIVTLSLLKGGVLHALTDGDGRFLFEGLAVGEYHVGVVHDGYVRASYGLPGATQAASEQIHVSSAQVTRLLDLALSRGGTLSGRVSTAQGRPARDASVMAMLIKPDGWIRMTADGLGRTDARGEYTLRNLEPGTYQIHVSWVDPDLPRPATGGLPSWMSNPGTEKASDALDVRVAAGEAVRNIDVTLLPSTRVRLSGHLLRGTTCGRIDAALLSQGSSIRTVKVDDAGAFVLTDIKPGRYTMWARCQSADVSEAAVLTLDLDVDTSDVVIPLQATGSIRGRVVAADGQPLPFEVMQVAAVIADGGEAIDPLPRDRQLLARDGTFELAGLSGERVLRVFGLDPAWTIARILHGKSPVASLTIQPGDVLSEITVVLSKP